MTPASFLKKRKYYLIALVPLLVVYFVFDPSTVNFMPKCFIYHLTGWQCPGCGVQRMIHALLHADFAAAWNYNAFLICASPFLAVVMFASEFRNKYPRLYSVAASIPVLIAFFIATFTWGVLRNVL